MLFLFIYESIHYTDYNPQRGQFNLHPDVLSSVVKGQEAQVTHVQGQQTVVRLEKKHKPKQKNLFNIPKYKNNSSSYFYTIHVVN